MEWPVGTLVVYQWTESTLHANKNGSIGQVVGPPYNRSFDNKLTYPVHWLIRIGHVGEDKLLNHDEEKEDPGFPAYLLRRIEITSDDIIREVSDG